MQYLHLYFCKQELEKTFTFWGTSEGDVFHPVECMHQLLEQVRRHRVSVDGNVCTVMVTILVLEAVGPYWTWVVGLSELIWFGLDNVGLPKVDSGSGLDVHMEVLSGGVGWQRKLDPGFDIMSTLKTLLLKEDWARSIDYFFPDQF
ncbi:hypothetical protein ZIOFF_058822 [Zingiber officinale]|uniref:Uncharacterized protein n=1 Tax=Zingiber officinale TaxID=94328 RepID=A0A8J5KEE6_ZINOF|nr:hypothetical protein ZIOFF_058822 [Zingiber officinale]